MARAPILVLLLALGCNAAREAPPPAPERAPPAKATVVTPPARTADFEPPDAEGWGRAGELRYLEVVKGGGQPDQKLPLVVMIHGLGDRPRDVWVEETSVPMRVIMPQAPIPYHGGFAWFGYRVGDNDPAALAQGIARAASQLARALELLAQHRPTAGRPIVGGFSQGGMLSYARALRHPQVVEVAYPVAGMLPRPLWPAELAKGPRVPPIHAAHGDADTIVPIGPARALTKHLMDLGHGEVTLKEYRGVSHIITPDMAGYFGRSIERSARIASQTM